MSESAAISRVLAAARNIDAPDEAVANTEAWSAIRDDKLRELRLALAALNLGLSSSRPPLVRREMDTPTTQEFADILERNGFPGAASDIANGKPWPEATAYLAELGFIPEDDDGDAVGFYDDGEGRWLRDFIRGLHGLNPEQRQPQVAE